MSQTDLITIPAQQDALQVFTTEGGIDPLIDRIRREVDNFTADVSTAKGRAEVKAFAFSITKAKTSLEAVGKALAAEQKLIPGKIDACRRRTWSILEAMADEVRKPLTEYEEAEKARIARHREQIARFDALPATAHTVAEIDAAIAELDAFVIGADLDGFAVEYAVARDGASRVLRGKRAARVQADAEEAERIRLQQEAAERAAREREERIRAEEEAARAEAAAKAERDAAARREQQLRLDAEAAERRAAETELRLKREAEDRARQEAEEAARREADTRRRNRIQREAVAALVAGGITEDVAKLVVTMIARKAVPHVAITY